MSRQPVLPERGRIVEVLQGRDRGQFGVVIGLEGDRFVLIADGEKRKVEKPKKKNAVHIRATPLMADEVAGLIQSGGKVTNAKLRYAMRAVLQLAEHSGREVNEGKVPDGEG